VGMETWWSDTDWAKPKHRGRTSPGAILPTTKEAKKVADVPSQHDVAA